MTICKVCDILSSLPEKEAEEINDAILEYKVTAEFAASAISRIVEPVGCTTVKRHRKERHV